jgi:hypothetical protein
MKEKNRIMNARGALVLCAGLLVVVSYVGLFGPRQAAYAADQTIRQDPNEVELGKLYKTELALRIWKDIRILTLLDSNDLANAKAILHQDLQSNVSSLRTLGQQFQLDERQGTALKDAEKFIQKSKRK